MGLEMADAARPASLRAHRCEAFLVRGAAVLGKVPFGGCYRGAAVGSVCLQWGGEERGAAGGDPPPPGVLLGSVPAVAELPEFGCRGEMRSSRESAGSPSAGQSCTWHVGLSHAGWWEGGEPSIVLGSSTAWQWDLGWVPAS